MKKLIVTMLSVVITLSVSAGAVNVSEYGKSGHWKPANSMTKAEFADYVNGNSSNMPQQINSIRQINKAELLRDLYMDGFESSEIQELEQNGIYMYNYQTAEDVAMESSIATRGEPNMTYVMQPAVAYDKNEDEWLVTAGGKWTDLSWVPLFGGKVGGYECVGFLFDQSNISTLSSSKRPRVQEVIASLISVTSNLNREDREVINYNLNVDEVEGVGSYLQDRALLGGDYIGENYAIVVTYDNRFENVTGDLKSYYVHTDSGIELTGFQFSVTSAGKYPLVVPLPSFSKADYEFKQVSKALELGG